MTRFMATCGFSRQHGRRPPCWTLLVLLITTLIHVTSGHTQTTPYNVDPATSATPRLQASSTQSDALRDIKPLRPPKKTRWPYLAALLGGMLVLLAALFWFWRKHRQRQRSNMAHPILTAEQLAIQALQALHRVNFADAAAVRRYYFTISEVIRTYVENRFHLTATQLTTEEIFQKLPLLVELNASENFRFRAFLAETDRVKYAKHQPTPEEISATHQRAVDFVRATSRPTVVDASPEKVP